MSRKYTVRMAATAITGAITLVQIKAGAANSIRITSVVLSQSSTTTNAQQRIQILRKSVAATVTSATPAPLNPTDAASAAAGGTSATGVNASGEGTDSTVIIEDVFSVLTGWIYKPIPEEMPEVAGGGFIAIKFPAAPGSSTTYSCTVTFEEFG